MFAFVLLFAVAFAQTAPTQAQCNFANAKWENNKCVCNTTDLKVVLNGTTYECKKCEGMTPKYNETALACRAMNATEIEESKTHCLKETGAAWNASETNPDKMCICNATLNFKENPNKGENTTFCVCTDGNNWVETKNGNVTTVECKKCDGNTPIYNATTKQCEAQANNTNTTNVTCNATLYQVLDTTTNKTCKCMEGFTATNNATAPCFCNTTTHNITTVNNVSKCVAKQPANNTVSCDAKLYLTLNKTSNQCVCMTGFASTNNATAPCVCNATGANIIKTKDNDFRCGKCEGNTTYNATTQTCVQPANNTVSCDAKLYLTLNATSNKCVCMTGFTSTNNATAPCACNTTGANIIKIKDNDYKCDKCGANQNYDAKTQTCVNKPNNGVNGLFVLLAMALFFLF